MKSYLLISLLLTTTAAPAFAASSDGGQYAFKAAMVYNIARFTTWPPSRFSDAAGPVVLCVAPDDPLATELGRLDGQPVRDRRLQVRRTSNFNGGCHLAFVPDDMSSARLEALNQQGVLTIGDSNDFARNGAVGLIQIGRQVRFEINTGAARRGDLVLSSQLLRLAIRVK